MIQIHSLVNGEWLMRNHLPEGMPHNEVVDMATNYVQRWHHNYHLRSVLRVWDTATDRDAVKVAA